MPKHVNQMPVTEEPLVVVEAEPVKAETVPVEQLKNVIDQLTEQNKIMNEDLEKYQKAFYDAMNTQQTMKNTFDSFVAALDEYHVERTNAIFALFDAVKIINKPFKAPQND